MKKRLHDRKRLLQFALSLCLILMSNYISWGQTVQKQSIGSFLYVNGGFEGYATGNLAVTTSGSSTAWTIQNTVTTLPKIVTSTSNGSARTGSNFIAAANSTTNANRVLQSPTTTGTAPVASTPYTIQFYYRKSTVNAFGIGVGTGSYYVLALTNVLTPNDGAWLRKAVSYTPGLIASNYLVLGRLNTSYTAEFDDVVIYAGAEDSTAPTVGSDAIVSAITSSQQTINWTAGSDTEGAVGYMVVRSTIADPASTPNQGGIYSVGNTVATDEQVVYMGNGTNFTDLGLTTGTTYFYRIYTVDKAFNYSATALSFSSTTTAPIVAATEPTVQASGLTLGNVTGSTLDINWTAGNGSNSLVLVKAASAVDTDPTDGGIYTANLAFGSGTPIGTGNYAVYTGTGNSATITGLTRGTTYFVKVYTFNVNVAGSQNYLITSPASGSILNLPYQNTFTFNSSTEGYTTSTRFTAPVQTTESSNGVLSVTPALNMNNLRGIVTLSSSFAKVDATNKYAHITLKNTSSFDKLELGVTKVGVTPTYISASQTLKNGDTNYTTYDFDLTTWDVVNQFPTIAFSRNNTWISGTTYAIDDIVVVNQTFYKNIASTATTTSPLTNIADWTIVDGSAAFGYPQTGAVGNAIAVLPVYIDSIVYDNVIPTLVSNGTGGGDWGTGATWAGGAVPTSGVDVNIVGSDVVTSTGTRNCNQLSIASGSSLTLAGGSLTVKNGIINNGTVTVENNANLIQTAALNTNLGSGTATVKRNSNPLLRSDYTLWSSPVTGQNLLAFSPATTTTRFYNYNTATNLYNAETTPGATPFTVGKGYLIRMPNTDPLTGYDAGSATLVYPGQFTGTLNNGTVAVALTDGGSAGLRYNLVGNPYPSPINIWTFVSENTANIESTLYFWRKTNGSVGQTSAYCTFVPGALIGDSGTFVTNDNLQSVNPLGVIQTGQGFFVAAKSGASTLNFNNTQRVINIANQFFRTNRVTEPSKIWLNATNATGNFSQMAVTYFDGATIGVDAFDAKYINDSGYALTSSINGGEYTIQGRPAFDVSDVVALNFKTAVAGNYTIAIDHVEGLFSTGQTVFLKDNLLNTVVDLSAGSYSFASAIGTFNSRFEVVYQNTLAVTNPTFTANSVIAFSENGEIRINSGSTIMERVRVYDLQGRLLLEKKQINASETKLSTTATNQVLLVEITAANGSKITKKIIQ